MDKNKFYSLVIPMYNEEGNAGILIDRNSDAMNGYHLVMGYITLYSDSCEMSLYNASIADAIRGTTKIPPIVYLFMNKYTTLNRSFISWTMIPRINALFRLDKFNDIYIFI